MSPFVHDQHVHLVMAAGEKLVRAEVVGDLPHATLMPTVGRRQPAQEVLRRRRVQRKTSPMGAF
jgi:hypothetical protein